MLDLYLIRHAESEMNRLNHLIRGRSNNPSLSEAGIVQARRLGNRLKNAEVKFDRVYSSKAERAYDTACIVSKIVGYSLDRIVLSEDLLELDQGDWEGKLRCDIYSLDVLAKINSDNWNFKPPNGESQRDVEERMMKWVQENLLYHYKEELIAGVFTHGLAIKCFLRGIMSFDPKITYKIDLENTSITRLKYSEKGWHLITVNDAGHLIGDKYIS